MVRLNGWKRIGIVASIAWIIGAGIYTVSSVDNSEIRFASSTTIECEDSNEAANIHTDSAQAECDKLGTDYLTATRYNDLIDAAIVGLIPVPIGWGFAYLILFLVSWVKRGFMSELETRP